MKLKKEELLKALEIVKPGLAGKEIIEQTTSFAFINECVVTYNDEISISYPVKNIDLEGAIKAEELYQLLSKIKKDEIDLEISDDKIQLKTGKGGEESPGKVNKTNPTKMFAISPEQLDMKLSQLL